MDEINLLLRQKTTQATPLQCVYLDVAINKVKLETVSIAEPLQKTGSMRKKTPNAVNTRQQGKKDGG